MRLEFDEERAYKVFDILQKLWTAHEGIFSGIVLPQDRFELPDDPIEKANTLLFTAITQRGGIVSEDPVKYLAAIRKKHPDLFDPQSVIDLWSVKRIEEVLRSFVVERRWKEEKKEVDNVEQSTLFKLSPIVDNRLKGDGLYKAYEFALSWRRNAETLVKRWQGDVLNMFAGVNDFEGFFTRADYKKNEWGIHGMRRKILSLFTIWLQKKKLVQMFPTPIPVDFHAMRILFATDVVIACDIEPFRIKNGTHPPHFANRSFIRVTERLMDEIAIWS